MQWYLEIFCKWMCVKTWFVNLLLGISVTTTGPNLNPGTDVVAKNQLADYSYITEDSFELNSVGVVLRCASGLGPGSSSSLTLGGWYFDGNQIATVTRCSNSSVFDQRSTSGRNNPGIINLYPCDTDDPLSADEEGVYSCMMKNSSMMVQTTRVGLYLSGRSESVDMYPITLLLTIFHLYTQLLQ